MRPLVNKKPNRMFVYFHLEESVHDINTNRLFSLILYSNYGRTNVVLNVATLTMKSGGVSGVNGVIELQGRIGGRERGGGDEEGPILVRASLTHHGVNE